MPACTVEQQDSMCPSRLDLRDFQWVSLHGFGIGVGDSKRRAGATRRADRAEETGFLVAPVSGLARLCSASDPLPHDPIFLAHTHLILESDLHLLACAHSHKVRAQRDAALFRSPF